MMRIVDLSSYVEMESGEPVPIEYERVDCKSGADLICENIKNKWGIADCRLNSNAFPDGEFISKESVKLETHTGTHIDAPSHFGSSCNGQKPKTIDECPLEWFVGDGVLIDVKKDPGQFITKEDIENCLSKKNHVIKQGDIVLINTGSSKKWGTSAYFSEAPGMSTEATEHILSFGVKVIGIDTYGFDRPFKNMIDDFLDSGDNTNLWPAHVLGRKMEYVHIERMNNLDALSPVEKFTVCCFPIKLKGMDAAWTRAVALIHEE